jgi:hypothetical protein
MVDTSKEFTLIRGRALRVTKLDACGAKVLGPDSTVTSKGFVTVGLSPQFDEGTTISVTNAAGEQCILDEPSPLFTGYDIEVNFCGVNPDLIHLMTGQPIVKDQQATPQGVGFRTRSNIDTNSFGFALEVWSSVPAGACVAGQASYGYFLVPFVSGGSVGDISIGNDAVNFILTGAKSKDGTAWGVGPYNVVADTTGAASPLATAMDSHDHLNMELTPIAPPTPAAGATALGVPATSAVAGIPATLVPANSYAPYDLAAAIAGPFAASPTTAWTTGQYVLTRSGAKIHWSSTAWVAGVA